MFPWISLACDQCNIYMNLSPNDYQNSIGIYMRQRIMFGEYNMFGEMIATRHTGHGNDMAFWGQEVHETYQTYEIRGNYYFREKWKTTVILPIVNNDQKIGGNRRYSIQGIGDPIVLQSYQIFNTKRDTVERPFSQRLTLGGGIKFPLGKTDISFENGTPNLDLQPGTGSWDLLALSTYSFKWRFLGMNANFSMRFNGKDELNYRYGKVFNATVNAFSDISLKQFTIRLLGGGYLENARMDMTHGVDDQPGMIHKDTGGKIWFANAGIQFFTERFLIFGEYQHVISSELNGFTQLLTKNKINIGITYNF